MYNEIKSKLEKLINKKIVLEIDVGRKKKAREIATIKGVYNRIFITEINNMLFSFSYSDIICKTIIIKAM